MMILVLPFFTSTYRRTFLSGPGVGQSLSICPVHASYRILDLSNYCSIWYCFTQVIFFLPLDHLCHIYWQKVIWRWSNSSWLPRTEPLRTPIASANKFACHAFFLMWLSILECHVLQFRRHRRHLLYLEFLPLQSHLLKMFIPLVQQPEMRIQMRH